MAGKSIFICFLVSIVLFAGCKKDEFIYINTDTNTQYDVILVIGQSNAYYGYGFDAAQDNPEDYIWQFGRFGDHNYKIISAVEPLEHFTVNKDCIGFAMTFAKYYKRSFLKNNHQILIIPAAYGGTGFINNYWNPGDTLYNDAVERTNYILNTYVNSNLVAILWHQGETDENNERYQENLDNMIVNLRNDLVGKDQTIPFILGGFVPYWADQNSNRVGINNIIENTPERVQHTGYANPRIPYVIEKKDNEINAIHFEAAGLRELGRRYFTVYSSMMSEY